MERYASIVVMIFCSMSVSAMDSDAEFKAWEDPEEGTALNKHKLITSYESLESSIPKKEEEVITSVAHHPFGAFSVQGIIDDRGNLSVRESVPGRPDYKLGKGKVTDDVLVRYSPDGDLLAASGGGNLLLTDDKKEHKKQILQTINAIQFSGDSEWFIVSTSSEDGLSHELSFFNIQNNVPLSKPDYIHKLEKNTSLVAAASLLRPFNQKEERLACNSRKKGINFYTFDSDRLSESFKQQNSISIEGTLHALSFTRDGKYVLCLKDNDVVQLNPLTGIKHSISIKNGGPCCLVALPQGKCMVGTRGGELVVIDPFTDQDARTYHTRLKTIKYLSVRQDGKQGIASDGSSAHIFMDADEPEQKHTISNGVLVLDPEGLEKKLKKKKCMRRCLCVACGIIVGGTFLVGPYIIRGLRT